MCRQAVQRLSIQWACHMAASPQSERRSRAGGALADPWPLCVMSTHRRPPPGADCSHRRSVCLNALSALNIEMPQAWAQV